VQIVDVSGLWVRVAVLTLKRRESPLRFVLFPMIHIGSRPYYQSVRTQVDACDLAVVEGVGRSRVSSLLSMSYRIARFRRGSGLVVQDLGPDSFGIPVVHVDISGDEVRRGWRQVPLLDRLGLWCVIPVLALAMLVVGPRRFITWTMRAVEHGPERDEQDAESPMPELDELMSHRRDRLLLDALADLHEQRRHEDITIAVVYGAEHIPAVVRGLTGRYGYVTRAGEFLTVVDL